MSEVRFASNEASREILASHLTACDRMFDPALSSRVDIREYATKLSERSLRLEAWASDLLIGLVAVYCNDEISRQAFVSNVSVLAEWQGEGLAQNLMARCIQACRERGMRRIALTVSASSRPAIAVYVKCGFMIAERVDSNLNMTLDLEKSL